MICGIVREPGIWQRVPANAVEDGADFIALLDAGLGTLGVAPVTIGLGGANDTALDAQFIERGEEGCKEVVRIGSLTIRRGDVGETLTDEFAIDRLV